MLLYRMTSMRVETVGIKTMSCTLSCLPLDIFNVFCSCTDAATSSDITEKRKKNNDSTRELFTFILVYAFPTPAKFT